MGCKLCELVRKINSLRFSGVFLIIIRRSERHLVFHLHTGGADKIVFHV